ncbi:MAG: TIGR00341 family protein [Chitinophagales bacterium]
MMILDMNPAKDLSKRALIMNKFLDHFKLFNEQEDYLIVVNNITKGIIFRGTNLWVLIFAIFIASLGLNVNSTAVIIGAMLISPLMGPIMGLGLGIGINDLGLVRKALENFILAAGVGLISSTIYFLITPLNEAHSEILARTTPTIYDVLIAFFGGLAGITATSSKLKGNVIPGVAIATALMPPLCTAGYGLATLQFQFFFDAFYLFLINSVFIALATLITVRVLGFPLSHLHDPRAEKRATRIVWVVAIFTLLPSIYFGYDIVQQNKFTKNANRFIEIEANLPNDYLLKKNIDFKKKLITLVFGGEKIEEDIILQLKSRLKSYNLEKATLEIKQGFAYLADEPSSHQQEDQLSRLISEKEISIRDLKMQLDSISNQFTTSRQVFNELKVQYAALKSAVIQPSLVMSGIDSMIVNKRTIVVLNFKTLPSRVDKAKIEKWIKVRLQTEAVDVILQKQ